MKDGQKFLPINQSMDIFSAYEMPVLPWAFVRTAEDAWEQAVKIGFPVVMKVVSQQIIHKVDVGGVRLNLNSADDVQHAFKDIMAVGALQRRKLQLPLFPRHPKHSFLLCKRELFPRSIFHTS